MGRKLFAVSAVLVLSLTVCVGNAHAFSDPTYGIDEIYDNVNTENWLETDPTFIIGQDYDVTIIGHGDIGTNNIIPVPPESFVSMGAFINLEGPPPTDWNAYAGDPVVIGGSISLPLFAHEKGYQVNGSFHVPNVPIGQKDGYVWLHSSFLHPPDSSNEAFNESRVVEQFGAHVVPEPATMALLSIGLLGGGLAQRKKRS